MSSPCRSPVPSGQADQTSRAGRPLLWAAGFVLIALVAGTLGFQAWDREVVTPSAPGPSVASEEPSRADAAAELLDDLTESLTKGSRRETVALAASGEPSARRNLAWLHDNVRDLGIKDLSMRFVDEGTVPAAVERELGPDAWVANVAVRWRIGGFDGAVNEMEVGLTVVDEGDTAAFGSSTDVGERAPLWLLSDLTVVESPRALVAVNQGGQARRYHRLADQAVRTVRKVLPGWDEGLVVEVPGNSRQLHRMLGAKPGTYDSIAAVTAVVDGSERQSSPVHIFANPEVFGDLGEEGSQIVMSHEAAHVALDAADSTMPLWLLEGFADYVALADSDLPVNVTGSQILDEVRKKGPPESLPGKNQFSPSNKLLGTSYEAAWLACRLLSGLYGEERLIEFYRNVDQGKSVEEAFAELGTTEEAFTAQWRRYLRELA